MTEYRALLDLVSVKPRQFQGIRGDEPDSGICAPRFPTHITY
jgi:hypothetical protein